MTTFRIPMMGLPDTNASVFAASSPTRSAVTNPGPRVTAIASNASISCLPLPEGELEGEGALLFVDDSPKELLAVVDAALPVKLYRIVRAGGMNDFVHEMDDVNWKRIGSIEEIEF